MIRATWGNKATLPSLDLCYSKFLQAGEVTHIRQLYISSFPVPSYLHFCLLDISVVPLSGLPFSGILGAWMCDALHRRCPFWTFKNVPNVCGHQTCKRTWKHMFCFVFIIYNGWKLGEVRSRKLAILGELQGGCILSQTCQKISGIPSPANQMHVNQECLTQKYIISLCKFWIENPLKSWSHPQWWCTTWSWMILTYLNMLFIMAILTYVL